MNLEQYRAEIFRRSEKRIKRRKVTRRMLALCIPLVLVAAVLMNPPRLRKEEATRETVAELEDLATGSIFCSYVKAALYLDGETIVVTDKLTVDKLYCIAGFAEDDGSDILYYGAFAPPLDGATGTESVTEPEAATEAIADMPVFDRAEESKGHIILFTTAEGNHQLYYLTEKQYKQIMEVLE